MAKLAHLRAVWLVAGLVVCLGGLLTACGGSSDSSTGSDTGEAASTSEPEKATDTSGSEENPAVAAAIAEFEKYVKPQPEISIPPLPAKPKSGVKVAIVACPLPVCRAEMDPAKKAAEELGWNVEFLQTNGNTPEAYQTTFNQIVANPPEAVAAIASVPFELIESQVNQLAAQKIPVVMVAPIGVEPNKSGPVYGVVTGAPQFAQSGRLMGDAVVADKGVDAKTVYISDPSVELLFGPIHKEFTKVVSGAEGEVDELQIEAAQIGKGVPTQVVSYVQSHPETEYLAFALNDFTAGVPQALESAGLNEQVKIVSRAPQPTNLENIQNGSEWVSVAEENSAGGYRSIDQLARVLQNVPLGDLENPPGWAQIINSESVTETEEVPVTPGYPTVFQEAWHLK